MAGSGSTGRIEAAPAEHGLAEFSGNAATAAKQLSVDDDATTDTDFDQQEGMGFVTVAGATIDFGKGESIGVILDRQRHAVAQTFHQKPTERHVAPGQQQAVHDGAVSGHEGRQRDADAAQRAGDIGTVELVAHQGNKCIDGGSGRMFGGVVRLHTVKQDLTGHIEYHNREPVNANLGPDQVPTLGVDRHGKAGPAGALTFHCRRGRVDHQPGLDQIGNDRTDRRARHAQIAGQFSAAARPFPEQAIQNAARVDVADRVGCCHQDVAF